MKERFWDKEGKYSDGILKSYQYWSLEASFRQHTLGSFIIFSKRNIENYSDLRQEEVLEMLQVMKNAEDAVLEAFGSGKVNYLQMGNDLKNLHIHGIPRYEEAIEFGGRIWQDENWGHFPNWEHSETNIDMVYKVRDALRVVLK